MVSLKVTPRPPARVPVMRKVSVSLPLSPSLKVSWVSKPPERPVSVPPSFSRNPLSVSALCLSFSQLVSGYLKRVVNLGGLYPLAWCPHVEGSLSVLLRRALCHPCQFRIVFLMPVWKLVNARVNEILNDSSLQRGVQVFILTSLADFAGPKVPETLHH